MIGTTLVILINDSTIQRFTLHFPSTTILIAFILKEFNRNWRSRNAKKKHNKSRIYVRFVDSLAFQFIVHALDQQSCYSSRILAQHRSAFAEFYHNGLRICVSEFKDCAVSLHCVSELEYRVSTSTSRLGVSRIPSQTFNLLYIIFAFHQSNVQLKRFKLQQIWIQHYQRIADGRKNSSVLTRR